MTSYPIVRISKGRITEPQFDVVRQLIAASEAANLAREGAMHSAHNIGKCSGRKPRFQCSLAHLQRIAGSYEKGALRDFSDHIACATPLKRGLLHWPAGEATAESLPSARAAGIESSFPGRGVDNGMQDGTPG